MQLPGLLVEYLVNGSCALIWVWILFLIPGVNLPAGMDVSKMDGARIALLIPILYVLGMTVDFLSLITVRPFAVKYLRKGRDSSIASNAKILLHSVELGKEYIMRSSRDRIARGMFINSVLTTIVLTIYYLNPPAPRAVLVVLPIGLVFSGLCFSMWYRHERITYKYQKSASDALKEKLDNQTRA
jgi:hypothetical protein